MKKASHCEAKKLEKEKTVHPSPNIKDIAEEAAKGLFIDIMTMPEDTIEAFSVIQGIAIKNDLDHVTYTEFVENLPHEKRKYAIGHIKNLEVNRLIFSDVLTVKDGSEELYIYVVGLVL